MKGDRRSRSAPPPRVWLAAVGAVLVACAAGPAPRDHFYRLEAGAPHEVLEAPLFAGTLEVRRLRTDALTDGSRLLYRTHSDSAEVRRYPYHHWLDSPTAMVQEEMAAYLRAAGAAALVVTPETRVRPDYVVSGRIVRFERVLGESPPGVVVELELHVTRQTDRALLLLTTYREERQADGPDIARSALAMSRALADIFDRFLADASSL